jgi:uncharacterized repeat protein (TIGR04138 family)
MHHHRQLEDIVRRDPRYACEAYEFVFAALEHTQNMLGRTPPAVGPPEPEYHVSGPQLLDGVRDLALRQFGLLARTVFRFWGINRTADFGEIVFNLVEANLMCTTAEDDRLDFVDVYDLDEALVDGYRIEMPDEAEGR